MHSTVIRTGSASQRHTKLNTYTDHYNNMPPCHDTNLWLTYGERPLLVSPTPV